MEAQRVNDDIQLAKAMKIAFEDQLVQKVMPKLRGIETRGKSKSDCLDKIQDQVQNGLQDVKGAKVPIEAKGGFNIVDDYKLACEFGYGQFIWNSANYLQDDNHANSLEAARAN